MRTTLPAVLTILLALSLLGCENDTTPASTTTTDGGSTTDAMSSGTGNDAATMDSNVMDSGMMDSGATADVGAMGDTSAMMKDATAADVTVMMDSGAMDGGKASTYTWTNGGKAFVASYCVKCHSAGAKDFNTYESVVKWSAKSRCGTASTKQAGCGSWPPPMQFPVGSGPKPTAAERSAFVAWIDAKMPK